MSAPVFATVDDLQAMWRPLMPTEKTRAEKLLPWVSAGIAKLAGLPDGSDGNKDIYCMVTCLVTRRMLEADDDTSAVSQMQQTVGPFSGSVTYANPSGAIYLTKQEQKLLGIGKRQVASIWPYPPAVKDGE
ncbi:MAG: phage Gp19/Gp15/Gp42 family protein [Coriobacteriales bacterium]|jgi:hypothetical protein|nr:phage Gp19/Gp15/Gp42 family protein [Coriobacteriales bacterium]